MLSKSRTRRMLLNALVALLVITGLLWSSAAVFAQSSAHFSLGCWSIASAGGDQRTSVQFRMRDAITPVGGDMQGAQFRMRTNFYVLRSALSPTPQPPGARLGNDTYLPILWGNGLLLQNLCK